jgi:hydrogenase nickel incorporation protein HypA/HybF
MHEIGIASSIIDAVRKEMAQHPLDRAEKVGIRIGALTAVDKSALQFCFEVLTRDTELGRLKLEVDCVPRRHRCPNCPNEFEVKDYDFDCPRCGSFAPECISGDELELAFLEVEEHEPTAA